MKNQRPTLPANTDNIKCTESVLHHYLFTELSNIDIYKSLKLRSDVFVVEQNCVYPDLDDKDIHPLTLHLLASNSSIKSTSSSIVAYARCLAPGVSYAGSSIGRVAVASEARGFGLARQIMTEAIELCRQHWPNHNIQIGAQVYLQEFYVQLGFTPFSEAYDEDGIMHIDMQYNVTA